jgi:hypothetical protein
MYSAATSLKLASQSQDFVERLANRNKRRGKMAPRYSPQLVMLHDPGKAKKPCQSRDTGGGAEVGGWGYWEVN